VLGYEVLLSNNHTLNGVPFVDICDELVGKYPKTFKFTGWHPLCRCKAVPILPSNEDTVDFATGELEKLDMVEKMPENFTGWVDANAEKMQNWKSQPYFIQDNFTGKRIDGGLKKGIG